MRSRRLLIVTAIAFVAGAYTYAYAASRPQFVADLDQVWDAARALGAGENPYDVMGPQRARDHAFPLYYPLTAPLLLWPTQDFAPTVVRVLFVTISTWLFGFAITRDGLYRLPVFCSGAYLATVQLAQWTPLIGAVLAFPTLGFVLAAKPNLGLVVLAASRSIRAFVTAAVGALLFTALSLLLWPGWFADWRETVATADHFTPLVTYPGGFLLLLALLRWRHWDARLLLALALIPQTHGLVGALLLLLIPQTTARVTILSLLSFLPYWLLSSEIASPHYFLKFTDYVDAAATVTLWTMYIPALGFVLWPQDSQGHEKRREIRRA